jgi:DNA-binding winged helix-turn-helix (wHTH) protein/TolB-like protein/Flp pilus assembly protein TadD
LETKVRYEFGPYRLDTRERALRRGRELVTLPPKALDLLVALVTAEGRIVGKDELFQQVWPGTFVEENNLSVNISALRKVLGEAPGGEAFIETVPRRGYRFAAPLANEDASSVVVERTRATVELIEQRHSPRRRWIIASGAVTAVAALTATVGRPLFRRLRLFDAAPQIESLAVLPFKGTKAGDELGFGLADATITRLARLAGVRILPTQSVKRFDVPGQDPIEAGRQLRVAAVVDGTLQQSGDRIRLTVQLIRVADGKHLWARAFDHQSGDLFALEDALAGAVSDTLGRQLTAGSGSSQHGTSDPEAHRLYLAARYHLFRRYRNRDAMRKAAEYAERAIARDPNYPEPYIVKSTAYGELGYTGAIPPREGTLKAKEASLRAVELAPDSAEAHASLAFVQQFDYDLPACQRSWQHAIELDPDNDLALMAKSDYCLVVGRFDESLESRKRAQQLVPLEPLFVADVAHPLYRAGRYEEALVWTRRALEMDPKFPLANTGLSEILRSMGRYEESVAAALKWQAETGTDQRVIEGLRAAFDKGGIRAYDQKRLENALEQIRQGKRVSPLGLAIMYTAVGDKEPAVDWLEKAFEERDPRLIYIKTYPPWKPLHGHPRFDNLLARLGLA